MPIKEYKSISSSELENYSDWLIAEAYGQDRILILKEEVEQNTGLSVTLVESDDDKWKWSTI